MMQLFINYIKAFEGYLGQLESLYAKLFLIFLLWVSGAFLLTLVGFLGGMFSGWFTVFSIITNIVWIIIAILIGAIITDDA